MLHVLFSLIDGPTELPPCRYFIVECQPRSDNDKSPCTSANSTEDFQLRQAQSTGSILRLVRTWGTVTSNNLQKHSSAVLYSNRNLCKGNYDSCTVFGHWRQAVMIDHVSHGGKGQLTARDNLRIIETDMVRPGTAALIVYHDE